MQRETLKNLRFNILKVLAEDLDSRNSDIHLTLKLWLELHKDKIFSGPEGRPAICLKDILRCVREDHVKRLRAKIQNEEHRFLPTTFEVRKQRKINEQEWNLYCNNNI